MFSETFVIGKIVNTHGVKGTVKVYPYIDDISRFKDMKAVYLDIKDKLRTYKIEFATIANDMVLMKFKGIDSIEDAKKLKDTDLVISRKDADPLKEGEFYISDLINTEVIDVDKNEILGKVKDVLRTGSNDVYIVRNADGREILIPVIEDVVKDIQPQKGYIKVRMMEGLI